MISSTSVHPCTDGDGFEVVLQLDATVVKGSLEQQGYPVTPAAARRLEERRLAALSQCVEAVNRKLPPRAQIKSFSVAG
jgi:hypothetical protein